MKLRTVAIALVLAALAGAGGTLGVRALLGGGGESLPQPQRLGETSLEGVPVDELADQGWQLSPLPQGYALEVSSSAARHAVGKPYSKASARQILLAQLETQALGGLRGPVWIINFDPNDPALPTDCPGTTTIYALSFVDADTGELLSTIAENSPSTGGCGPGNSRITQVSPTTLSLP